MGQRASKLSVSSGSADDVAQLMTWDKEAAKIRRETPLLDRTTIESLWNIASFSQLIAKAHTDQRVLVKDESGGVVAGAKIYNSGSYIYIDYLATHPKNLIGKGVKGGGSTIIIFSIERSINLGFHGRLELHSLNNINTFYFFKKIGFQTKEKGFEFTLHTQLSPEYGQHLFLSSEAAQKFLTGYRVQVAQDTHQAFNIGTP